MTPVNLALRFLLELTAFAGIAMLARQSANGTWRHVLVLVSIAALGAIWATFNVPGDPSRSGHAPVQVPGVVRLVLELAILFGGAWAFYLFGHPVGAAVMGVLILGHYAFSLDRIRWLLAR